MARRVINWRYGRLDLSTQAAAFGPFAEIVTLWRDRRGPGDGLPDRADFDFFDFRGWWGRIAIATIEKEPFDVRFVLWGTSLAEWWGVDYTNKRLGEHSVTPEAWEQVEQPYFENMVRDPFIGVVSGYLDQHGRPSLKVIGVDLPLGRGREVNQVLSAHMLVDKEVTIEGLFGAGEVAMFWPDPVDR